MKIHTDMHRPMLFSALIAFLSLHVQAADNISTAITSQLMHGRIQQTVNAFVLSQTTGYPGKINVIIQPLDSRLRLADCTQIEAFLAPGVRLWGKTHVGVRCNAVDSEGQKPWSLYVQTEVQVFAEYAVTALPVGQGSMLSSSDVMMQTGDLSKLPNGVMTDMGMVTGKQAAMNLPLGTVLRPELLKSVAVILRGQTVQLSSRGPGFVITTDGTAMQSAQPGQVVDVKVSSGQTIKGVAQSTGKVEVNF